MIYSSMLRLVGWLCLMYNRQQGHLDTASPFTIPCEGREARFLHPPHRTLGGCVAVHYTTAAPHQLPMLWYNIV